MTDTFLAGYYGMRNSGDDALLAVTAWGARHFLRAEKLVASAARLPVLPGLDGVRGLYRCGNEARDHSRLVRMERRLCSFIGGLTTRRVIFGGGSVFHTHGDLRDKITLMRCAAARGHVALGVGIGPFRDSRAEKTCAELLKRLSFVGVRDEESLGIARAIAPDANVEKTFDLAPLLGDALAVAPPAPGAPRRGIGIALCKDELESDRDERIVERVAQAILRLPSWIAYEVVLIDFNGHDSHGDAPLHRRLAERLRNLIPIRHLPYDPNPANVLRAISGLDAIVAMRLHAAVFGFLADTPTTLLSYHPKCDGWARDIGLSSKMVHDCEDLDPAALASSIESAIHGGARPTLSRQMARDAALLNWTYAKDLAA
ncbi:polysaccharide pyruvyl transferase family protein (plasmid) [Azospirillum argentinense]|uniref:Polysaccharide pyruvyl transferase family protein n=1 Tax=Azospirillum argentinense TaxID=2970906 RepID=A0A4D8PNZ2_9PROT|nr:polysaccharide pyruvyl transferase family protein [Azospirillum argentinense]QCN97408.1 polysaccharide pyruvyl transferase family protein [Azospirillum argentinense]